MYGISRSYDIYEPTIIYTDKSKANVYNKLEELIIDIIHGKLGDVSVRGKNAYIYKTNSTIEVNFQLSKIPTGKMYVKVSKDLSRFSIYEKIIDRGFVYNDYYYKKICIFEVIKSEVKERKRSKFTGVYLDSDVRDNYQFVLEELPKNKESE